MTRAVMAMAAVMLVGCTTQADDERHAAEAVRRVFPGSSPVAHCVDVHVGHQAWITRCDATASGNVVSLECDGDACVVTSMRAIGAVTP